MVWYCFLIVYPSFLCAQSLHHEGTFCSLSLECIHLLPLVALNGLHRFMDLTTISRDQRATIYYALRKHLRKTPTLCSSSRPARC
uniref:Putative secreted peptide n=1 Tax=Anopheles braziliensis TaxID=58242 RepID=A0A2M3ZPA3_9DIPT